MRFFDVPSPFVTLQDWMYLCGCFYNDEKI